VTKTSGDSTRTTSRERLIEAGAELFGRQGYHGTGIKQVVDAARAPFASLYHFFPGGKEELGAVAIRRAGAAYAAHVGAALVPADDIVAATEAAFAGAAVTMRESDFADACPIATIALEVSSSSEPMRNACDDVFRGWIAGMAEILARGGVPAERAEPLATQWLALLEGAFIFCRAARTTDALEHAGRAATALVRAAMEP
jgi:AcrR family transcriptional regulator